MYALYILGIYIFLKGDRQLILCCSKTPILLKLLQALFVSIPLQLHITLTKNTTNINTFKILFTMISFQAYKKREKYDILSV